MTLKKDSIFMSPRDRFFKPEGEETERVALGEIMAYTGDSVEVATEKSINARKAIANDWRNSNPQTPEEVSKFYVETEGYIYDLFTWSHQPQLWELLDKKITGNERVLDYGCGIGDIAIYLAEKGCNVTAVDLPNSKTLHFAMWRIYQRNLGSKINFTFKEKFDKYDVILAIDVLEHVWSPLRYVVQLSNMLRSQDSWFFATPTFKYDEELYPMHLKHNDWLLNHYYPAMESLGFQPEIIVKDWVPAWHALFIPPAEKIDPNSVESIKERVKILLGDARYTINHAKEILQKEGILISDDEIKKWIDVV